ncbi:MAG TPA: MmcQ/YjbR family DNA-binding protein [Gemmataceae bacterium]|nr:MmcQ/YjbR family DNA-binding protein [Gemmataceae bacterium]
MPPRKPQARAEMALRDYAMTYPQATEDFPWDHRAIKVKGKMFLILSGPEGILNVTVKLPESGPHALGLPFTEPTGYGLGKSGWVTASFWAKDTVPLEMIREWIDESYRAVAPRRLVAALEGASKSEQKPKRKKK